MAPRNPSSSDRIDDSLSDHQLRQRRQNRRLDIYPSSLPHEAYLRNRELDDSESLIVHFDENDLAGIDRPPDHEREGPLLVRTPTSSSTDPSAPSQTDSSNMSAVLSASDQDTAPTTDIWGSASAISEPASDAEVLSICPFWFLGCLRCQFDNLLQCFLHSLVHFREPGTLNPSPDTRHVYMENIECNPHTMHLVQPPNRVSCPFRDCNWTESRIYGDESNNLSVEDDWAHWRARLEHIEAHLRNGNNLQLNGKPEYDLAHFLHNNNLITRVKFRDLYEDWNMTRSPSMQSNVRVHGGEAEKRLRRRGRETVPQ
ncbi:hypothetical protein P152DRAFT_449290 [Eremomyces bilateralis CBS 781.70]|uniref:Uncharacterized protein n=1 Tax=Eremomyces bilateralis CBS 781.70 TaxID=1392243 RepID=A0A6G1G3R3_9PEZI|nr:uncharacterized protein P152DRAFT_449290 [Eremomyces bilateralis CBS 781.70]KAF1812571.1 hypothetical protein P152DRAFT_449290 [Eremomyces bilateralis CBS 781.70]